MKCSKFPERDAAGVCSHTGKPYCSEELIEIHGKLYGRDNLGAVMSEIKESSKAGGATVFMNAGGAAAAASSSAASSAGGTHPNGAVILVNNKSRGLAIFLALLLGGLGAHKFYLGRPGLGIFYMFFCFTLIPSLFGFIDAIALLFMGDASFHKVYGRRVG